MKRVFLVAALIILLRTSGFLSAEETVGLSEAQITSIMRKVNTAEMTWRSKNARFGSLRDLIENKLLSDTPVTLNVKDAESGTVEDYNLRLTVSSDAQHYVSLLARANACGLAMFTTEQGVIYRAKPLGCE